MGRVGVAVLVIALAACGGSASTTTAGATSTAATTTTTASTTHQSTTSTAATTTVAESTTTVTAPLPVDALTWDRAAHDEAVFGGSSAQAMLGVAAGGPGLVAVGYDESGGDRDAAVWLSADGITWERIAHDETVLGGPSDQEMRAVVADGSGFIAVGYDREGSNVHAAVWVSSDGAEWTRLPHQPEVFGGGFYKVMSAITAGGPGFVAAGYTFDPTPSRPLGEQSAAVWTSSDGIDWHRVSHTEAAFGGDGFQQILGLAAGGPGVVAVGDDSTGYGNAAVWVSADGNSWSRVPHDEAVFGGTGVQVIHGVIAGGPGLVAVGGRWVAEEPGDFFAAVWVSADGFVWESIPHDPAVFGGRGEQQMYAVTAAGPGLVAVGSDSPWTGGARVWVSPDGLSWSRVVLPDGIRPVIGPDDVPAVSSAGAPWYAVETIRGVVAGGPGLVAVGQTWVADGGGSAAVIFSPA